MGNINNPETILHSQPEDAKREARYAWEAGIDILGPECAVPTATANANLSAIAESALETAASDRSSLAEAP